MERQRSPNYPSLSLREAVERARALHAQVGQNPHSRDVVARGMGYSSLSGASAGAISALKKYGLLDGRGEEIAVTDRAMAILHPHSDGERQEALRAAATEPEIFRELAGKFPDARASDDLIRNYLLRNKFAPKVVDGLISAYRETIEFAGGFRGGYDLPSITEDDDMLTAEAVAAPVPKKAAPPATPVTDGRHRLLARYDFEGGGNVEVRITGDVDTDAALDMVETLMGLKRKELERRKKAAGGDTTFDSENNA